MMEPPSCMSHTFWCAVADSPAFILLRRVGNLHKCKFLQHYHHAPNLRIHLARPPIWVPSHPVLPTTRGLQPHVLC
ncbi:hypothetical protein TNCV_4652151 [Trichonephila clavipes]|nr:hypothetical protein TNCV_4652151 [Trichonephila clavipes]